MAFITKENIKNIVHPYSVGERVLFILEGTKTLVYGTVIDNKNALSAYTIEDDDHNQHTVPHDSIFRSKEHFLSEKGLKEFDCEVFMERHWSIHKTVIATTLEDAIASLKEEFPDAHSIREADHWR